MNVYRRLVRKIIEKGMFKLKKYIDGKSERTTIYGSRGKNKIIILLIVIFILVLHEDFFFRLWFFPTLFLLFRKLFILAKKKKQPIDVIV